MREKINEGKGVIMSTKFCENCGEKLSEGVRFCPKCGADLSGAKITAEQKQVKPMAPAPKKRKSKLKIIGGIIGAIVVLLFLASLGGGGGSSKSGSSSGSKTIQVKAEEMVNDYIQDSEAAQKKYKDKKVEVTGKLIQKTQFKNTENFGLQIYQKKDKDKSYSVMIDVKKDDVAVANKIKEGDFVKAEGTCIGTVDQDDPNHMSIQIKSDKVND